MWVKSAIILCLVLTVTGCGVICRTMCPQCNSPSECLTMEVIEQALNANLDSHLIARKIRQKGVTFELTDETRHKLKKAKANKIILDAVEEANRKKTCGQSDKWF